MRNFLGGVTAPDADVPADRGDLLAELRNSFLAEGLEQCGAMLRELKSSSGYGLEKVERLLNRWAVVASTLGFPEISEQARRMEALITATTPEYDEVGRGIETVHRRFCAATRYEPMLPPALIRGLKHLRIGLVNFSEEEASRISNAASRATVEVVMERMSGENVELQTGYDALIVNQCTVAAELVLHPPHWPLPSVFIGSRSSLESLPRLSSRAHDFLIAPWDAEEALLRVHRLIGKAAPAEPAGEALHVQKRRPRILIADDDPDMVALVSDTLGRFGMDCDIARSGQQALDAIRRHPPDAIVLDVNMLDLDGFEVLKQLRHNLATTAIPVLMLTARNQRSDIARCIGSGADDYVVKPFEPSDLAARVDKIISASRIASGRR